MPTTYAIPDGRTVMAATLYTGNATARTISNSANGVSFQPDLVWIKMRSVGSYLNHHLVDSVRGDGKVLYSNLTNAEDNLGSTAIYTTSTGFGLSAGVGVNENSQTLVGWQWNAGGSTVTNTSGSISAQVRANTTAGFSIVTYTGTGANATVGHGLGVTPSMVIVKARSTTGNWCVTMPTLGANNVLFLDLTNAAASFPTVFNGLPTSTIFNIGTAGSTNTNAATYVAYCFAAVAGYSAFGSYTGNGSADGPFVFLGFRPRFVIIRRTDAGNNWHSYTSTIDPSNVVAKTLYPNTSGAEGTENDLDFVSNGMKMRDTGTHTNASGGTYIYMAWAENPFKYANAR